MLQQIKAESPSAVIIKTHPTLSLRWNDWPLSCLHTASIITIKKFNQNFFYNGKFHPAAEMDQTLFSILLQSLRELVISGEEFSDRLRFVMKYPGWCASNIQQNRFAP